MKGNILLIAIIAALTLTCCNDASKHEKSGLTTVSTITPEAKEKYFSKESGEVYDYGDCDDFEVTALGGFGAYVRQKPDVNSKILKTYTNGTHFRGVYTDKPNWIRIISHGKVVGYIHDENVSPYIDCGEYYIEDYNSSTNNSSNHKVNNNSSKNQLKEPIKNIDKEDINETHKKSHYHFSGYMTDNEGDHPIELDFDASNNGLSNIVYKNVTLGGKIHMKCTEFSGIQHLPNEDGGYSDYLDSFTIVGKDGPKDFIMSMTRVGNSPYEGTASVGSKKLTVMLYLE